MVRDNIGPLKTLNGIVITTDNDMANIMNNFFTSVLCTIEQLNNVLQLGHYEGNIIDTFNFITEKVQKCNISTNTSPQDQICFTLGFSVH